MPYYPHRALAVEPRTWRARLPLVLRVLALLGLLAFGAIADGVLEHDALSAADPAVTSWVVGRRTAFLTSCAWALTHLGGTRALTLLTLVAAGTLALRGRRRHALVLVMTMSGASLLTVGLKLTFGRSRPSADLLLGDPALSFAFPSGHAFNTAVLVGSLAGFVLLSPRTSSVVRATAVLLALGVALGVGLSRVYLAYHWLTDVVGGWVLAVGWLSLCALLSTFFLRPERRARAGNQAASAAGSVGHEVKERARSDSR